jgi:hypothetical protein
MSTPVAVKGEITATAGSTPHPPAASGTWTAGPVVEVPHSKLAVGGKAVVLQAMCTFTFTGQTSSSPPVPVSGVEVVVLSPGSTILLASSTSVLLDGDTAEGNYGNKLEASAAGHLATG